MFDKNKTIRIAVVAGVVVVVIILISVLAMLLRKNPYGEQIKIDNIGMVDISQDDKDLITHQLYGIVLENVGSNAVIPQSGAWIREETYQHKEDGQEKSGSFIVDIAEIQQSYLVQYDVGGKDTAGGYPILITCPEEKDRIYEGQKCANLVEASFVNVMWQNKYQVEYSFGKSTAAKIFAVLKDNISSAFNNPKNNTDITAVIDETSMRKYNDIDSGIAYTFDVVVNGVTMNVVVRCDDSYGNKYIAIYAKYGDKNYATLIKRDAGNYDNIVNWLAAVSGQTVENVRIESNY